MTVIFGIGSIQKINLADQRNTKVKSILVTINVFFNHTIFQWAQIQSFKSGSKPVVVGDIIVPPIGSSPDLQPCRLMLTTYC